MLWGEIRSSYLSFFSFTTPKKKEHPHTKKSRASSARVRRLGQLLIDDENEADVGRDVHEVRGEALVEPAEALLPERGPDDVG